MFVHQLATLRLSASAAGTTAAGVSSLVCDIASHLTELEKAEREPVMRLAYRSLVIGLNALLPIRRGVAFVGFQACAYEASRWDLTRSDGVLTAAVELRAMLERQQCPHELLPSREAIVHDLTALICNLGHCAVTAFLFRALGVAGRECNVVPFTRPQPHRIN